MLKRSPLPEFTRSGRSLALTFSVLFSALVSVPPAVVRKNQAGYPLDPGNRCGSGLGGADPLPDL